VWIAQYQNWLPDRWDAVPPRFRVLEPAVAGCLSQEAAAHWLQGFNADMLAIGKNLWAVAVAVQLRYEGDLAPGQIVGERGLVEERGIGSKQGGERAPDASCVSVLQAGLHQTPQGFCQSPQRSR
jgi:hypothetical protein